MVVCAEARNTWSTLRIGHDSQISLSLQKSCLIIPWVKGLFAERVVSLQEVER